VWNRWRQENGGGGALYLGGGGGCCGSVGGEEKGSGAPGPRVGGARDERGREEHGETFAGGGELRAANSSRRPELDGDGASA
jgi:hypothetical protein